MKTNLLQKPLLYPNRMGGKPIGFTGANPLLKNQERFDEVELEKNLNTKEGQIAFLQYHLEKAKGSQGFIARGFNKLKSWTGLGLSSKKLDEEIAAFMAGQVPFEKVLEDINKFKYNQKEATEVLVDTAGAAISFTASHAITNFAGFSSAICRNSLNKGRLPNVILGALIGCGFKAWTKLFDSFGMEKSQRKANRHFFRDMFTGSIAGASGAIPGLVGSKPLPMFGSIAGGIALNSGVRYLSLDKEDKSFSDFLHQQIENPGIKLFATAAVGTLALCNYKNLSEWEKVAEKSKKKIDGVKAFSSKDVQTSFETLAGTKGLDVFSKDPSKDSIYNIIKNNKGESPSTILHRLEQKNMFYPKYLQTLPANFANTAAGRILCTELPLLPKIIELVKSECTGARTKKEAQDHIDKLFGKGEYTIVDQKDKDGQTVKAKPLGVGSVAETWVVKNKAGKEYVIKMVKPGVSIDNLEAQEKELEAKLKGTDEQVQANKKCLENLFNTWKKELDLKAEAEAAKTLANGVKNAHVVKPIETSQDGTAYIMEKADGQLFSDYLAYEKLKASLGIDNGSMLKKSIDVSIAYANLYFEQIFSVPQKGDKVIHADPHPGNIFISLDDKGKVVFTFIDTGNVIRMSNKEAVQNLYAHLNYFIGNTEGIAANLLKGAKYPAGMDEKKAIKELKQELDSKFYNGHTYFNEGLYDLFSIFNVVDTIATTWMEKNKIISNPDNTNMHKAEYTYLQNNNALHGTRNNSQIYQILNKYYLQKEKKVDLESITEDDKKQLISLYRLTFDGVLKEIKNIRKLINEKSQCEYLKPKVLFNKYLEAITVLKAMSICDGDDSLITKSQNELNENVREVYKAIETYNQGITDTASKELAEKSYKVYYNTFAEIGGKKVCEITNTDLGYQTEEIEPSKILALDNQYAYHFKSEYKKDLDEINKQEENYKNKKGEEEDDYLEGTINDFEEHPVNAFVNMFLPTIKSVGSSMFYHPFKSIHEVAQTKKYLDENKERAINTFNLLIHGRSMGEDANEKKRKKEKAKS